MVLENTARRDRGIAARVRRMARLLDIGNEAAAQLIAADMALDAADQFPDELEITAPSARWIEFSDRLAG